jgi:hypothetical protein
VWGKIEDPFLNLSLCEQKAGKNAWKSSNPMTADTLGVVMAQQGLMEVAER